MQAKYSMICTVLLICSCHNIEFVAESWEIPLTETLICLFCMALKETLATKLQLHWCNCLMLLSTARSQKCVNSCLFWTLIPGGCVVHVCMVEYLPQVQNLLLQEHYRWLWAERNAPNPSLLDNTPGVSACLPPAVEVPSCCWILTATATRLRIRLTCSQIKIWDILVAILIRPSLQILWLLVTTRPWA